MSLLIAPSELIITVLECDVNNAGDDWIDGKTPSVLLLFVLIIHMSSLRAICVGIDVNCAHRAVTQ